MLCWHERVRTCVYFECMYFCLFHVCVCFCVYMWFLRCVYLCLCLRLCVCMCVCMCCACLFLPVCLCLCVHMYVVVCLCGVYVRICVSVCLHVCCVCACSFALIRKASYMWGFPRRDPHPKLPSPSTFCLSSLQIFSHTLYSSSRNFRPSLTLDSANPGHFCCRSQFWQGPSLSASLFSMSVLPAWALHIFPLAGGSAQGAEGLSGQLTLLVFEGSIVCGFI